MYPRSIIRYFGVIIIFSILFQVGVSAKDVCNDTDFEQVISDGKSQQYIPPHMCVTVDENSSVITPPIKTIKSKDIIEVTSKDTKKTEVEVYSDKEVAESVYQKPEISKTNTDNKNVNTSVEVEKSNKGKVMLFSGLLAASLFLYLRKKNA